MENLKVNMISMLKENDIVIEQPKGLHDIKDKNGAIKEERNGFLIYSKITIDDNENLKNLYKDHCKSECKERNLYRYYYYEKFEENNPLHATIVMMNPAFADSENSDDTINNIKKYLHNEYNHFGSFDIINLYPIRMPNSTKLKDFLKETEAETKKYQKFIKTYLKNNCKNHIVIAAWGSDKHDNKIAKDLFKDLDIKFYCYGLAKEGYPKHFAPQSFNKFNKFRYPFPFIKINNWLKNPINHRDYDKNSIEEVKRIKSWIKEGTPCCIEYINHMANLLEEHFNTVK